MDKASHQRAWIEFFNRLVAYSETQVIFDCCYSCGFRGYNEFVRLLRFHRARSFLEEQERRLLQAYARYGKQRRKKQRAQNKERIEKQVRRLLARKHP